MIFTGSGLLQVTSHVSDIGMVYYATGAIMFITSLFLLCGIKDVDIKEQAEEEVATFGELKKTEEKQKQTFGSVIRTLCKEIRTHPDFIFAIMAAMAVEA